MIFWPTVTTRRHVDRQGRRNPTARLKHPAACTHVTESSVQEGVEKRNTDDAAAAPTKSKPNLKARATAN